MSAAVSLDPYRTRGVRVFTGYGRGRAVGRAIRERAPGRVQVEVPGDVYLVDRNFWRGLAAEHRDAVLPFVELARSLALPGEWPFASAGGAPQ